MPQVTIDIDAQGNVVVGTQGVKGSGCQALTKALEAAIGKTSTDEKTSEFFLGASCTTGLGAAHSAAENAQQAKAQN